jgi:3-hydroxyisobutyrate dehydrogenase-like beta-hydroxyacid dehydrogenase
MGDVGAGQLTKLINQLLFDINAAALAEILPLASKLNIDPSKIGDVVNSGTGRSYASEFFIPHVLSGSFNNGYPMDAAYKDLISGAEISARFRIPTPVLAAATSTYQQALLEGHGDKDKGGMILVYERLLGVSFRAPSNYSNPASQTNKKRPSNESL